MPKIELYNEFGFPVNPKTQPIIYADTWLPLFPGFNETIYSASTAVEYYVDVIAGIDINCDEVNFDNKRWENDIAKLFVDEVFETLNEFVIETIEGPMYKHQMIHSLEFQSVCNSKNYYISNDIIYVRATFSAENIANITKYIYTPNLSGLSYFDSYLKRTFTPRDGFAPGYSNSITSRDWIDLYKCFGHEHKCGSILECLLKDVGELEPEEDIIDWEDIIDKLEISDYIITPE